MGVLVAVNYVRSKSPQGERERELSSGHIPTNYLIVLTWPDLYGARETLRMEEVCGFKCPQTEGYKTELPAHSHTLNCRDVA